MAAEIGAGWFDDRLDDPLRGSGKAAFMASACPGGGRGRKRRRSQARRPKVPYLGPGICCEIAFVTGQDRLRQHGATWAEANQHTRFGFWLSGKSGECEGWRRRPGGRAARAGASARPAHRCLPHRPGQRRRLRSHAAGSLRRPGPLPRVPRRGERGWTPRRSGPAWPGSPGWRLATTPATRNWTGPTPQEGTGVRAADHRD
jgi:hypothetical protein